MSEQQASELWLFSPIKMGTVSPEMEFDSLPTYNIFARRFYDILDFNEYPDTES
jgi:hypothetical protein